MNNMNMLKMIGKIKEVLTYLSFVLKECNQ